MLALLIMSAAFTPAGAQDAPDAAKAAADLARKTAAERLSLPIERLAVVRTAPAEWRDSSLGCPERGRMYTPILTSGFRVTLKDADREHEVHVAGGRAVMCGTQGDPKRSPVPMLEASRAAGAAVRTALAERLRVKEDEVRVVSTRPRTGSTPACDAAPATASGVAFLVEARAMDRTYWYYTDDDTTLRCDAPASGPRR